MFSQPMSFLQTRSPESPGKPLQRHLQRIGRCSRTTPVVSEGNLAGRCDLDGMNSRSKVVEEDRKSTRLNSSHLGITYAVFCLKKIPLRVRRSRHSRLRRRGWMGKTGTARDALEFFFKEDAAPGDLPFFPPGPLSI